MISLHGFLIIISSRGHPTPPKMHFPHRRLSICGQIPGAMFSSRRMGTHFPGIFRLLPVFRHIRCHVRKFDCGDRFLLWLYVSICIPVCGGGDQLVLLFYKEKDHMSIKKTDCPDQAVHFLIIRRFFSHFHKDLPPLLLRNQPF